MADEVSTMNRPNRSETFDPLEINIAHTVQRCVRRAFLAGNDEVSKKDYSYRREWIRRRLEALASVFGMDVLSYAVLSNHLHVVIRNRPDVVEKWSDHEVAIRWLRVYPGRRIEEHLAEPTESDVERLVNQTEKLKKIRKRLSDISWFMKALAEPIARMANLQDNVTGRFWEGRFKAQKITDEAGLLACTAYVDLNPIRAALAESLEAYLHTSAYDRIAGANGETIPSAAFDLVPVSNEEAGEAILKTPIATLRAEQNAKSNNPTGRQIQRDSWLAPLTLAVDSLSSDPQVHSDGLRASDKGFLHINWSDYLSLLRWTATQKTIDAAAKIPDQLQKLLTSLGIDAGMWSDLVWNYKKYFGKGSCVGSPQAMADDAKQSGRRWHRGQKKIRQCFVGQTG